MRNRYAPMDIVANKLLPMIPMLLINTSLQKQLGMTTQFRGKLGKFQQLDLPSALDRPPLKLLKNLAPIQVMILCFQGKKTKKDCIDAMTSAAHGQVILLRLFGFILLWCGFCMMFALVSFFADRVGSLIPCGLGEMFSDCVDCIITVITCPPACACWLFWFSLA